MAPHAAAAGALEGMEAPTNAVAQPARVRYPRTRRPPMGVLAQGLLARRRLLAPPARCLTPTGLALACKGFTDPYRRFREC